MSANRYFRFADLLSTPWQRRVVLRKAVATSLLLSGAFLSSAQADDAQKPDPVIEQRLTELLPALEAYIAKNMKDFDVPGLSIGIISGDKLVYAKGFGVRSKAGGEAVDTQTLFQVGSTTKAFLGTTIAMAVDRGDIKWDDRVVDLDADFQMKDPWVTAEFRVFDLLAQRSGLPPYANDALGLLGLDSAALVRSLRYVDPVSSFRSTFAYTNITHIYAGLMLAKREGLADWSAILKRDLLDPLGMKNSSDTAAAIEAAPNHAEGYRFTPQASVLAPFNQLFPYEFHGAGSINSNIEDMAHWVRLKLGNGVFEGKRIVSAENLAVTRMARVAMSAQTAYAYGWALTQTANGTIVWHNGGTTAFGAFVGLLLDHDVGVVVLTNQANVGMPDGVGMWALDRLLGNAPVDHAANALARAKANAEASIKQFAKPDKPRPFPPLPPLAGSFASPAVGPAVLAADTDHLVLTLNKSGVRLFLDPWDGDVFSATVIPEGRFIAVAENQGPLPVGFVQFVSNKEGKLDILRLTFDDGQAYDFQRQ
jgi:CubicO group peptidase (beta-lactamase class C family)